MMIELHKLFIDNNNYLQYCCVAQPKCSSEQNGRHYLHIQIIFKHKQKHSCWFLDPFAGIYMYMSYAFIVTTEHSQSRSSDFTQMKIFDIAKRFINWHASRFEKYSTLEFS